MHCLLGSAVESRTAYFGWARSIRFGSKPKPKGRRVRRPAIFEPNDGTLKENFLWISSRGLLGVRMILDDNIYERTNTESGWSYALNEFTKCDGIFSDWERLLSRSTLPPFDYSPESLLIGVNFMIIASLGRIVGQRSSCCNIISTPIVPVFQSVFCTCGIVSTVVKRV